LSILKNIVEQEDAIDVVTFTHQIVFSDGFVSSEISDNESDAIQSSESINHTYLPFATLKPVLRAAESPR